MLYLMLTREINSFFLSLFCVELESICKLRQRLFFFNGLIIKRVLSATWSILMFQMRKIVSISVVTCIVKFLQQSFCLTTFEHRLKY